MRKEDIYIRLAPFNTRYYRGLNRGALFGIWYFANENNGKWRRRRDSNPRDDSSPTPLAGERLRPLGHVSADRFNYLFRQGQGLKLKIAKFLPAILITY